MNEIIDNLLELQTLDFTERKDAAAAAAVRAKVPAQILAHYDRLVARGKKGVAVVNHQVCTACHVTVPRAVELVLMRGEDIRLCGNCGRYLSLPRNTAPAPAVLPPVKIKKAPRDREALLQTA